MNIIEALTLAKNEGQKVRPVCWNNPKDPPTPFIIFAIDSFHVHLKDGVPCPYPPEYDCLLLGPDVDELLGEWEVVP